MNLKKKSLKIAKIVGIILLTIFVLIIALVLSLRLPFVQNKVKNYVINYLEDKIETPVSLDEIYVGFPNSIVLDNLYLEGQKKDTLLYAQKLDVGLNIPKLLNNTVDLTSIDMNRVRANVVRDTNGRFNFDFIIDAFATEDSATKEEKPWVISLDKIKLKDIGVNFTDLQQKNDLQVYFNQFETTVDEFDLNKNSYALDKILLDGLNLKLKQDLVKEVAKEVEQDVDSLNAQNPMQLGLNKLDLTNINIDYADDNTRTYGKIAFKELNAKINDLDLPHQKYDVEQVKLAEADLNIDLYLPEADAEQAVDETKIDPQSTENNDVAVFLEEFTLDNVKLVYNNTAMPRSTDGIDFNHLNFQQLNLAAENFKMEDGTFAGRIESAKIQERENLNIQALETNFRYDNKQAFLKDLFLQTNQTILRDEVVLSYDSMDQLSNNLGSVSIDANITDSKIAFKDILNLAPSLRNTTPFNTYPNAVLNIDTKTTGTINNLIINHLEANGIGDLQLEAKGIVKNATQPENIFYDIDVKNLSGSVNTINKILPSNTIPDNISLPSNMQINGTAKGSTEIINADLNLKSTDGNAHVLAHLNLSKENQEQYDVQANLDDLNLGKIIQNKDLGKVSGKINAQGVSFDLAQADAKLNGNIQYIDYNGYRYNHMDLDGSIKQGYYDVDLNSKDHNANLTLRANGLFKEDNPSIVVAGNIRKLDLHALNFYGDPLILAGNINGDFASIDPDLLNGELTLTNFAISDTKDVYPLQEVRLKSMADDEHNTIELNSQIADVTLNGYYKLTEIISALQETLNHYYQFSTEVNTEDITPNQYIDISVTIKDDNILRKFVPELKSFENITVAGKYVADEQQLDLNANIPTLTYGENHVENGTVSINTNNDALAYNAKIGLVKNESFQLNKLEAKGEIANNIISYHVSTKDTEQKEQYLIAGQVETIEDIYHVSLVPNGLKLNYDNWRVNESNLIKISNNGGINAENFVLSNEHSSIKIQSENESLFSPINIYIDNFDIATITQIIQTEELPASGVINGHVTVEDLQNNLQFTSNLKITDLTLYERLVGIINAQVKSLANNLLGVDVQLSGNGNDAGITGNFNTVNSSLDLLLNLKKLQLSSLEGLSQNEIQNTEGYFSGKLNIEGTTEGPIILGTLDFNDVGLLIKQTGSEFKNINDKIYFRQGGIVFDQFNIQDKNGNTLDINGKISTQTYTDFAFNLDIQSEGFNVVDSEEDMDQLTYGVLTIDTDLHVGGDLDLPTVNGLIKIGDDTDFTFVVPQSSPTLQERDGIVRFVDKDLVSLQGTVVQDSISSNANITGIDVNVDISITKEAKISMIIDKASGDFVELQGEAELNGGIDPSGKTTLSGVYEVEEGVYELNVNFTNKRFNIVEGSTVTWNGDPLEATMDITANYKIETAPIDLLQQQLSGLSPSEYNMYKQRIPFNTLLKMRGDLLKPEITFDITLDDNNSSVASSVIDNTKSKLDQIRRDESELNKQVFALLLLNRFIGEDPFSTESGMSAESLVRESVSQILSQQLNNLAGNLIAGVDIDFDFDSYDDYSQGQKNSRTDLNVGLSKRLLNDRLKITVGSKFGLEGAARENEDLNNIAGDLKIDYMLSKNGRYMLRAYRVNEYEVALQGQIIETGIGFIINLDYDKFKDIFHKVKDNKEKE